MATLAQPQQQTAQDFLPLKGTDHIEFYVGNARQAAYFYRAAFGMSLVAYCGAGDGRARSRVLRAAAGQDSFCADDGAQERLGDCGACASAWRWRARDCALGGRCAECVAGDDEPRREIGAGAD